MCSLEELLNILEVNSLLSDFQWSGSAASDLSSKHKFFFSTRQPEYVLQT